MKKPFRAVIPFLPNLTQVHNKNVVVLTTTYGSDLQESILIVDRLQAVLAENGAKD